MTVFLTVLSMLALASLGFVTLVNNPKSKSSRYFFAFCCSLGLWVVANYLADADTARSLYWSRLTFTSIVGATLFFRLFVSVFPRPTPRLAISYPLLVFAGALMAVVTQLGYFIPSVKFTEGTSNVVAGPMYPTFIVFFVLFAGMSIYVLIRQYLSLQGLDKARISLILYGLSFMVLVGSILNLFLPLAVGNNRFANYGTYSTVVFAGSIYLAIVRHKLFNIRLIVARSVAYLLVIATMATAFAVILLGMTSLFFHSEQVHLGIKITFIALGLAMALVFQPLKRVFDRLSNSIFYRDAYNAQELIDTLNSALVTTLEIKELLDKSAKVIGDELKLEFCAFAIKNLDDKNYIIAGTAGSRITDEKIDKLKDAAHSVPRQVIVTDELEGEAVKLKELLQQNNLGAMVRLKEIVVGRYRSSGYILLGEKSSGSIYSTQDSQMLEILADELVIAIQNSLRFEEISRFNVTLQQKVDEATKELREANTRLKALDEAKDEFISLSSHQLRTPLTTVKGYLSMLLEGDTGVVKKAQKEIIQRAYDGAQQMVYLISDLLNVSRLQSGKFAIVNKPTDLSKVVETEVKQLQETALSKQLKLIYKKPSQFPELQLDEDKVRQVVMNFLDNAIYYTPAGGEIEVDLAATDKEVTYSVKDTGLGVPTADQHHLFTKFYRAGNARKARPDGTGLGLYMAKKVVTAQGGAIVFRSTEGKGSTFGFTFPRSAVEAKK